ncbi:MAG TPA: hypothetical protein P5191_16195 [Ruminococcus sp.]|nr:hypothetical protein [Ruminococcus sp.]
MITHYCYMCGTELYCVQRNGKPSRKLRKNEVTTMWTQGVINYNGKAYRYSIKHFEEPSVFGYEEGRASKIWIQRDGIEVFNFDRGDDVPCADKDTEAVLQMLLDKYN